MLFTGLQLSYFDQVTLAVYDILHGDAWLRNNFGGRTLGGNASITPATTTLTGSGTSWLTGADDSISPGAALVLGPQVCVVESVTSDTELELTAPHVNGLVSEEIYVAARGFRVDRPVIPADVATPFWTVGVGTLPDASQGIGRFIVSPAVTISFVYDPDMAPLLDFEPSWAGLVMHVVALLSADGPALGLCVDRFGSARLVHEMQSWAPGEALARGASGLIEPIPAIQVTYRGSDPIGTANNVSQRW